MKMKLNQKGFTLIEVVLVLAIGGLIFLLAFLAFQQVSANRRDTQRRNDAGRVVAELQNYRGDNNAYPPDVTTAGTASTGVLPAAAASFFSTYMGGAAFTDPGKTVYSVVLSTATPAAAGATTQVTYRNGFKCNPTGVGTVAQTGAIAVQIGLEKGVICRDDQ